MSDDIDILKVLTQPTVDLPLAGRVLGIGEAAARRAAKAGEIPTIKLGRLYRVPSVRLREMLALPPALPSPPVAA